MADGAESDSGWPTDLHAHSFSDDLDDDHERASSRDSDRGRGEGHDHGGHDGHGRGGDASTRKLALVAVLNLVGFAAELAGGVLFGSVALVSDAVHMLFDALAYVMAFSAASVATNYETSDRWSYGLHRLEPLSAFVNGALLIPMVGYILYEAYQRFLDPVAIGAGPTLLVAVGGLLVNVISLYVLEGGEMSLNEKGAFYHLLGDAGGSVAVIVAVIAVEYTGLRILDPLTAVLIAAAVVWSAGKLLRGSGEIFLHRAPLNVAEVRAAVARVEGVDAVADLHAWQICSEITVATALVETSAETMAEAEAVNRRVHDALAERDVNHATVELCPTYDDRGVHLNTHGH
jgi:cobalt-zinc-cadmium efflux system protein